MEFVPSLPCSSFVPPIRRHEERRGTHLWFVEQGGVRFVVKSYVAPDDGPNDPARRSARELKGVAAFRRAGFGALEPVLAPAATLVLTVDGVRTGAEHAMVFPFIATPTLCDAIAAADDPRPLLREAGARTRARHDAATEIDAIHSDGGANNVFADWTWFDFCEAHAGDQVREAKGLEIVKFLVSVVEISPAGRARSRVADFCDGYDDPGLLMLALDYARMAESHRRPNAWLKMLAQPGALAALWAGDTTRFRRLRTWDALDRATRR